MCSWAFLWIYSSTAAQGSVGKTGAPKQKLVLKKIVGHDEKTPMPLKYRCLRAAEEYRQRCAARSEALRRRKEVWFSTVPTQQNETTAAPETRIRAGGTGTKSYVPS